MANKLMHNPKTGAYKYVTSKDRFGYLKRGWKFGLPVTVLDEVRKVNKPLVRTKPDYLSPSYLAKLAG